MAGKPRKKRSEELDATIGARLRLVRVNNGWSQEKLAEKIGVTFQQVQKYEKGTNRVSVSTMITICKAMHLSIASFLDDLVDDSVEAVAPRMVELEVANRDLRARIEKIAAITGRDPQPERHAAREISFGDLSGTMRQ